MRAAYAEQDHVGWVERNTGKKCSPLGSEVANVLGWAGGGIYNCPIKHEKVDWSNEYRVEVIWTGGMTSWDRGDLTLLLVECFRRMIRVGVSAATCDRLRLEFWMRKSRDGGASERLPHIEELIEFSDRAHGRSAQVS